MFLGDEPEENADDNQPEDGKKIKVDQDSQKVVNDVERGSGGCQTNERSEKIIEMNICFLNFVQFNFFF